MRELTEQQKQAIEKLHKTRVGALFMACGTGKTQTASALVNSVDNVHLLYWVCPCRTKENLERELEQCGCKYKPRIVGVESIGCSDRIYTEERQLLEEASKQGFVFMVVDESIKIKNLKARRTRRLLDLSKYARFKLILNGTPITKNICDIYAQMEFLSPKILKSTYIQFRDRYCKYTQVKKHGRIKKTIITGYTNVDHLLSVIKPYVYQCELELKVEKRYHTLRWYMSYGEREAYEQLKAQLFSEYIDYDGEHNMLAIMAKLQHSYCLCEDKFNELEKCINDKSIIFCKYLDARDEVKRRYPNAMVLTYGTGSLGLNLQEYNRIIYFDKTFDYSFREQSEGRIYRNGQKLNCEYFDLTGDVGLEGIIDRCINNKESLVNYFKKYSNEQIKEMV